MTHIKALEAGQSSHGTSEPIAPVSRISLELVRMYHEFELIF